LASGGHGNLGRNYAPIQGDPASAQIEQIINTIETMEKVEINKLSKILLEKKDNLEEFLEYINVVMYSKINANANTAKYIKCIEIVSDAIQKIGLNCNVEMTVDNMSFELWEVINEKYCRG